jgi:hypothetical protein
VTSVIVCKSYSVFIEKTSDFCLLVSSHFTLRLSCAVSVRTEVSPDFDESAAGLEFVYRFS